MNEETTIVLLAGSNDPDYFDLSVAALERGLMGRRIRQLRERLGMSQSEFAQTYGIPAANILQYFLGRRATPPVPSDLKALESEPEMVRKAVVW